MVVRRPRPRRAQPQRSSAAPAPGLEAGAALPSGV